MAEMMLMLIHLIAISIYLHLFVNCKTQNIEYI